MIYEKWDRRLKVNDDDTQASGCIPQLTKREYRIITNILTRTKGNKEVAHDEFLKEVLNNKHLPVFSDSYKAENMWNQEKRLEALKGIMEYIYEKFTVVKGK